MVLDGSAGHMEQGDRPLLERVPVLDSQRRGQQTNGVYQAHVRSHSETVCVKCNMVLIRPILLTRAH